MRICVLVHQFPVRSETFVLAHAEGLLARGHEVTVVPLTPRVTSEWDYPADVARVVDATRPNPATMPASGVARSVASLRLAVDAATRHRARPLRYAFAPGVRGAGRRLLVADRVAAGGPFDIVHAQFGTTAPIAVALRNAGVTDAKLVCSIHGQDANVTAQKSPELFARTASLLDAMTVGTNYMRGVVERLGAPSDKVRVWPQGVDVDAVGFADRPDRPGTHVVSVGRLVEFKGVDDSLRVIAAARTRVPGLRYTVVGDGPLRAELEALASELGIADIVEFAGAQNHTDVISRMAAADVFLHMGKIGRDGSREGQGVAPIEASASGLPVIATNAGGLPEVVMDAVTGLVVDVGDIAAAADALVRLAENSGERREYGHAGRSYVRQNFSLSATTSRIEALYAELSS